MTIIKTRRLALMAATTAAGIAMIGGSAVQAAQAANIADASTSASAPTTVTFKVAGCDDCTIAVGNLEKGEFDGWNVPAKTVKDGKVTFAVPAGLTRGLSVQVRAPWEKGPFAITNAVFRYQGLQPGDKIGLEEAKQKTKGSACWGGTDEDAVTLRLKAHKVVDGDGNVGTIAWLTTTQEWIGPMVRAYDGVVATQDLMPCAS